MNFTEFNKLIQEQFSKMAANNLYVSQVSGDQIWETYLNGFLNKEIFRVNQVNDGNYDKAFVRRYGNIVSIIDNKLVSIWDVEIPEDCEFYNPVKKVKELIQGIEGVFIETFHNLNLSPYESCKKSQDEFQLGMIDTHMIYKADFTYERDNPHGKIPGQVYTFNHFHVYLPKKHVDMSGKSREAIVGDLNTTRQVFQKGLNIPLDTLKLTRDLIEQGSLLRGDMYLSKVKEFITLKEKFEKVSNKELWAWDNFQKVPFARFANELIGVTCIELAEGKDINKVCKDFNYRVDPTNYNKAKAPITPQMIAIAEREIADLGYSHSFERRFAELDDINVSEIRHINNDKEKPVGLFGKAGVPTNNQFNRHKRAEFDKVESVTIDKFMSDILPNITSMEVFLENRMEGNLVSLFTTKDKNAKNLFKWSNPFSWTYNGNLSGKSMIKDNVKAAGGKITGVLRCSLQWNDEDTKGIVDYDLHCKTPFTEIYYSNKRDSKSGGWLDVDMIRPSKIGIENITWQSKLPDGRYEFYVNTFCNGQNTGFKVEIEFDGNTYNYFVNRTTSYKEKIKIATVISNNGVLHIEHHLPETSTSRKLWNLDTNQFHKVNLVCTSPNYWGDNNIGTKEYFFMLQDCKTDTSMRAFHVDQLNPELMGIRKAIDLLGNYKMVEPSDKQLSGVGFNCTTRDELVVKVNGTHQRVLKITF